MRGAASVYGLRVAWEADGLGRDPVRRLLEAFAELPVEDGGVCAPDLQIDVAAGAPHEGIGAEGALEGAGYQPVFFQGNVRGFARNGEVVILAPAARVTIDGDGRRIAAVVDEATLRERGFVDTTLVIALSLALRHRGFFHLHAGALVRGDGTRVAVMGDSGSGKTTVTLGLLDAGAEHLGDDTLFFCERDEGSDGSERGVRLLAFPRAFHVGPATARAFPALGAKPAAGEAKLDVARDSVPGRSRETMDAPDVVFFPHVTREPTTRATPLSRADAFGLALHSCAFVAVDGLGQKTEQLTALRGLLAKARAFDLALGADWLASPERAAAALPWRE